MNNTKITAKIHPDLWGKFSEQCDALFLKKGQFLDHMIRRETLHLSPDLEGKRLSNKARQFIAGELKRCDPVTVNIEVSKDTAEALNKVVAEHNIVRDAFINRLIVFIRGTDALLNHIGIADRLDNHQFRGFEGLPTSPLKAMEEVQADPLYYIREQLLLDGGEGVYLIALNTKHYWTDCYLPDRLVPGTDDYFATQRLNSLDF